MRLNDWQSCNMSSDLVTSSDDFTNNCLYGFDDSVSPSSSSRGSTTNGIAESQSWDSNVPADCVTNRLAPDECPTQSNAPTYNKGVNSNVNGANKGTVNTSNKKKGGRNRPSKSSYKHVPHREKPPHLVARRNARERRRVQAVNTAFSRLRKCVPLENRNKRLSKVKTLQRAIEYINDLQDLLDDYEAISPTQTVGGTVGFSAQQNLGSVLVNSSTHGPTVVSSSVNISKNNVNQPLDEGLIDGFDDFMDSASVVNKENQVTQRWISLENSVLPDSFGSFIPFYDDYNQSALHA